jgi:large subunit ribosomal protein L10
VALNIEDKKSVVAEIANMANEAIAGAAAHYQGLNAAQMTKLRSSAREAGVSLKIVRNTLARRAFEKTNFECLQDSLVGPIMLAFANNEPSSPARLFRAFMKENEQFKVQAFVLSGKLHGVKDIDVIANLPTRDEGIAMLMSVMKAPITKFVRTIAEPHAKFVRTLAAVRDKMQDTGAA